MAIRKIEMRPPGSGDYSDILYPKTSADIVEATTGTVQSEIDSLKSGKAPTSHNHTIAQITNFPVLAAVATTGSYTSLSDIPASFTPSTHNHTKAQITDFPSLGTASSKNTGTTSGTIPILDSNGKLDVNTLPALAITDTFPVATQAAMLALTAETGDVAVRTDLSKSFILRAVPASILANWQELLTPTDVVQSVAGKTGVVTLSSSDVGLGNVTNESKGTMFSSASLTGIPTAPTASVATNTTQIASTAFVKAQGYLTAITKANVEAVLTGAITSHTHTGLAPALHAELHVSGGADAIPSFTSTSSGLVPLSGGGTTKYLRADGTFVSPPNTVYTHPTTAGNNHIPTGGAVNQFLKYSASGTAVWSGLTKSVISDFPTAVSSFTNDAGYITKTITIGAVQPNDGTLWYKEI